jgi:sulfur-carrier protein adenylyltransferase/sulfurtransferase
MPLAHPHATLYEQATPHRAGYRDVSAAAVHAARGTVRVVDVREPDELVGALGHIPGVEAVPLASVSARAAAWHRGEEIVLVCRSGARSGHVAQALVAAGFRRVMNLAGGMLAYRAAGLPVAPR